ncbi:progranulin-like [Oratosquilla oratoria]|uniref:progranulin-like n=1 Tax=Oratosquilla oratoria TaxID=337810 RepID=UPI003F75A40A
MYFKIKFLMLPLLMWFIPVGEGARKCGLQDVTGNLTSCYLLGDTMGLCHHPFGVCCPKRGFCCPMGFQCNEDQCYRMIRISFFSALDKMCPDSSQCPATSTCCLSIPSGYGCCPLEDAMCCPDRIHCCPRDTICSEDSDMCLQLGVKNRHELEVVGFHRSIPYA